VKEKKVYFIGAGPGDPELITLKGARIIREADVVIYTGSLVNPEVLRGVKEGCAVYDSSGMTLEQLTALMLEAVSQGKTVARVHTGDPGIYGAVGEQLRMLKAHGLDCEIVPGVSSFAAAAASLQKEYTVPGGAQTVILTRLEQRTPVPQEQRLGELARHKASMAIFLSVHMIDKVVAELLRGYEEDTPVAVVQKASWPEEKIVSGTLGDIVPKVKAEGISRTALILVGDFLREQEHRSRLYDGAFSHGFRKQNLI
jgi:precorrin-4/cobalt-precorrin-4 C11-methyltransferase